MQYATSSPNEDVVLFEGRLSFVPERAGGPITADGRVWFKWDPSPRPYFGLHSNDPRLLFERDGAKLVLHPADIELTTTSVSLGGAGEFPVHGSVESTSVGDPSASVASVTFHVPNLTNFAGRPLTFDVHEWRISIAPIADVSPLISGLRYHGGFGITHLGNIERSDGGSFRPEDVDELLTFLLLPLSFARGLWTGPILPIGLDAAGEAVWQRWANWKLGQWHGMPTWFDDLIPHALATTTVEMWRRWQDPHWHRPLQTLVSSLVEANTTPSTEVRLLLIQTTLELLSWMLLVETNQIYSERRFDKRSAADKVRALLSRYGVPTAIPQELGRLDALAKARGYRDGPDASTQLRNGLVHPHQKGRRRVETLAVDEKFEAAQLLHWYAEVVFLKDLGYGGKYGNRLKLPRWSGDVEDLP